MVTINTEYNNKIRVRAKRIETQIGIYEICVVAMLIHQLTDAAIPKQGENMENEIEGCKRIFREYAFRLGISRLI